MTSGPSAQRNLSRHILPNAATMVGVCMTVISIVKLIGQSTWMDELLALDSLLFLSSAFFSYLSIRGGRLASRHEGWADAAFMWGLLLMGCATLVLAFEII